ncbi:unnamed protein product [Vitrella brassicaformis CCMP3155]|uniref:F5/8 type C domain-containing protein n=1 Tax=Vitrella brassicaformis (strain CCMP3155) TaxID=1169540 RepID=A0A0G4FEA9_VITBC|nr:unnamed protein product [Vitrella brassicaformis CCMP3155]|eukprot:CEM11545.1 unnamed protein product [Vitrella brassicaformis CCMP3155]
MSPHHCVVLASFHVLTLLGCLPVTLGWRHDVSFGMSIANAGRRDGFLHQHTSLRTDDVPDILLGCHAPIHGLGQHAEYDMESGLPKGEQRELQYLFKKLTPPLHVGNVEDLLKSVAFIDWDGNVKLPRRLRAYSADEKVVQFETADNDVVKDANDWDKSSSRYGDEFTWSDLERFPLPDFWQLDLTKTQQVKSANSKLGLPLNHFKLIVLVYCPQLAGPLLEYHAVSVE